MSNSDEEAILEELQPSDFVVRANVSDHTYRLIKLILKSHLLFNNDSKVLLSCVPEVIVHSKRYRHGCIAMTLAAGLNAGIILFNKYSASSHLGNLSVIPTCLITVGSTGYVLKLISDYYKEQSIEKVMKNHIKILQKFHSQLQNILCDIKDFDVMTRGSALRSQTSESHDHKLVIPLGKFSVMVLITLTKIRKTMSDGFMSLREQIPETVKQIDFATTDTRHFPPDNIFFDETKISVHDLSNMNRIYQLVQSEYLRWLALCLFPIQPRDEIITKKVCVNVVDSVHSLVLKSYIELKCQHAINFCGRNVAGFAQTDVLAVGVHGIMIHLASLMEEVKRLDSSLHVVRHRQSPKDSLKLFAIKFNKFKIKLRSANDHIFKMDTDLKNYIIANASTMETRDETRTEENLSGISGNASDCELTGKSDFSAHGEHQVFIGTSFNDTSMATDTSEDYVFERRQLMPEVLNELKMALTPLYEMHAETEKQVALYRPRKSFLKTLPQESSVNTSQHFSDRVCNETHHYTEAAGETVINPQNSQPAFNNMNIAPVAGTSTMLPTNTVFVPDSISSASVIDLDVTECNTAVATDSCIPKSPAVDITDPTLLADSWASAGADSSESIICLPLSATEHCSATAHTVPVHPSPMRVGNIKMMSAEKTLVEEFYYDGDSESELTD